MPWFKKSPEGDCDRFSFLADASPDVNKQCAIWSSKSHTLFRGKPPQQSILSKSEKNSALRLHLLLCGKKTMCRQCWHATTRNNPGECQGEGRAQYCKGMGKGGGRVGVRGRHSETIGGGRGDNENQGKATSSEHRVPKPAL